jgi:hypothetical protein
VIHLVSNRGLEGAELSGLKDRPQAMSAKRAGSDPGERAKRARRNHHERASIGLRA